MEKLWFINEIGALLVQGGVCPAFIVLDCYFLDFSCHGVVGKL